MYISGTADAFASASYRNYLKNFKPEKYPKLKKIHLHTNGSLWTKEMWESMDTIHPYVKTCEISIDAATKETYEEKTRIGGKWDVLIQNLKYIATIHTIDNIRLSFVVQESNFREMEQFYDLIRNIFTDRFDIFYGRITNWGTFDDATFKLLDVVDINNPHHSEFLKEINKVGNLQYVSHNLHEFIYKKQTLI
jgi:MoaA/NifB/PqqE/SkfB family radical SAM enzyme